MSDSHTRTRERGTAEPTGTWLVAAGRAHRLGAGSLPAGSARRDWVLVEAASEAEALRRAREYCSSRAG